LPETYGFYRMKQIRAEKLFFVLLAGWFLLNLLQSVFTEITNDEAYYALWGKQPAFGYFDHPPMIAWLIAFSDLLFDGNLAVRFATVLLQIIALPLLWSLTGNRLNNTATVWRFFAVSASVVMFSAYGFITTPDVPLLFFTIVFLVIYRQFLKERKPLNTILLAITVAALIYSKYQSGLFLLLVVLANFRLLRYYQSWLAMLLALVLLIPHFCWHYEQGFPAFQYHLSDRSTSFQWRYLLEYWPNQLAVFNPFTLVAVIWAFFSTNDKSIMTRTYRMVIAGFMLFFWTTAFRGHVEPHWTIIAAIPMIILVMQETRNNARLRRYVARFVYPSVVLILIARILLVSGLMPERFGFNGKKPKFEALHLVTGNSPVVFTGSFQNPSLYEFFTGGSTTVVSAEATRRTQFDIWKRDEHFHNQLVFVAGNYPGRSRIYEQSGYHFEGFFTDSLQITHHLEIKTGETGEFADTRIQNIPFAITNRSRHPYHFGHSVFPTAWKVLITNNSVTDFLDVDVETQRSVIEPGETIQAHLLLNVPVDFGPEVNMQIAMETFFGITIHTRAIHLQFSE
jgi:hypothetical protein